jgi:hypothetical protein
MPAMRITALLVLAMLLSGCGPRKEQFDVFVKNDTKNVLSIGFTKDNGPDQDIFMPPEFMALDDKIDASKTGWGLALSPGKTATPNKDKPVVALLDDKGGNVYLRIYRGEIPLSDMIGISRGSPNRLDIVLTPGESHFSITEKDGRLIANKTQ